MAATDHRFKLIPEDNYDELDPGPQIVSQAVFGVCGVSGPEGASPG
jgi:hypothetical protein